MPFFNQIGAQPGMPAGGIPPQILAMLQARMAQQGGGLPGGGGMPGMGGPPGGQRTLPMPQPGMGGPPPPSMPLGAPPGMVPPGAMPPPGGQPGLPGQNSGPPAPPQPPQAPTPPGSGTPGLDILKLLMQMKSGGVGGPMSGGVGTAPPPSLGMPYTLSQGGGNSGIYDLISKIISSTGGSTGR